PVSLTYSAIRDASGKVIGISKIAHDITERKRAEEALRRLNEDLEKKVVERTRFYSIRAKISEAIVRVSDRQALFDEVCRVVVETGGFRLAWVGVLDPETREVRPVASFGASAYLEGIRIIAADVAEGKGPTGRAVYEDHCVMNTDFEKDVLLLPWRDRARAHSLRSSSAVPLHTGGRVIGALTIYSDTPHFFTDEEMSLLLSLSEDISFSLDAMEGRGRRAAAEEALRVLNEELDLRVQKRTADLQAVNKELEAFIYSVSHDLRAPIRSMSGFAKFLAEDCVETLDAQGKDYVRRIEGGAAKMTRIIDDLLYLSRITRQEINRTQIDLSALASSVVSELRAADPGSGAEVTVADGITAFADRRLMEVVLSNLLGNAWKFTAKTENARIEFGALEQEGKMVYYVSDNGAGFDPNYREKMFLPFQRLHSDREFEGMGIGLAIVERVIHRHAGRVWAEGQKEKGATIYFTLGEV
ncbi:MAG TPA: GAF domain-containing protein, partial [Thermodesulfovibrionales bacterium]|nr:GAF domain-containing protein [Thermodesulfovibrionales bacterium]